jgi:phosphoribosylformylglycinamidine cyclo-ligase
LASLGKGVHSLVHCTGGGQTKIKRFGRNVRFEKDNLFPVPPIFSLIQQHGQVPWDEMYAVFNMGHRLEACLEQSTASEAIAIAEQFGIAARVIGRVTSIEGDSDLVISSPYGQFVY